jgi:hydroxymethylpyrimidine pyrophosphatase-like HAD family hydrolase
MTSRLPDAPEQIQLIVADFDGNVTHPDDRNRVPSRTLRMMKRWKEDGRAIWILTGRTHNGVDGTDQGKPLEGWEHYAGVMSEQGAVVTRLRDGETVEVTVRAPKLSQRTIAALKREFAKLNAGRPPITDYMGDPNPLWLGITEISSMTKNQSLITKVLEADGYTVVDAEDKLSIHDYDDKDVREAKKDALFKRLRFEKKSTSKVLQVEYNQDWIMFCPYGFNKTEAFEWLLEQEGIDRSFTAATGDGQNDRFIAVSGLPVVPYNAKSELKRISARVMSKPAGFGFADLLEQLLGQNPPGVSASDMVNESMLDRFWTEARTFDNQTAEDYASMVETLLAASRSAQGQLIVDKSDDNALAANVINTGIFGYRAVRDTGRTDDVQAYFPNLQAAVDWAEDHGADASTTLEIQRNMVGNRWLPVVTYWHDGNQDLWHVRNRVAERAGHQVDLGDLGLPA